MSTTAPYSIRELPASYDPGFLKVEHQSIQRAIAGVASATDMGFSVVKSAGTTADSTNNILNAVASGIPFFPPGTYNYSQNLVVNKAWFGIPELTILKPSAAVTKAVDLRTTSYFDGFVIDGANTTNATGIDVGTAALTNIVSAWRCLIQNFLGPTAYGMKWVDLVTGDFHNLRFENNQYGLFSQGTMGTPTSTTVYDSQIRSSVKKGAWIKNGYGLGFNHVLFEANGEEGLYIQNVGDNAIEIALDNRCWLEANWQSAASGAARHTHYDIFVDGANGPAGTIRLAVQNTTFAGGLTGARAMHLTNAIAYLVRNSNVNNEAGQILVDGTSYGKFSDWPEQSGNFRTTVTASDYSVVAWLDRSEIQDNIESAWTDWVPTASAGTMTITGFAPTKARYKIAGKTCTIALTSGAFTTGGTATATIDITLPTNVQSLDAILKTACWIDDGAYHEGYVQPNGVGPTSSISIGRTDAAVWGLGANRAVNLVLTFELF